MCRAGLGLSVTLCTHLARDGDVPPGRELGVCIVQVQQAGQELLLLHLQVHQQQVPQDLALQAENTNGTNYLFVGLFICSFMCH